MTIIIIMIITKIQTNDNIDKNDDDFNNLVKKITVCGVTTASEWPVPS